MTEITQADRLLLADLFDLPQSKAMELFAGKHDENEAIGTKLEALARHREQAAAEERAKIEKLREALVEPGHPKEDHKSGWDDYRAAVYDAHLAKEDEKRQP